MTGKQVLILTTLLGTQVLACDDGPTDILSLISPGTSIDGMLVVRGGPGLPLIDEFCTGFAPHPTEPNVFTDSCTVPAGSRVQAGIGWLAVDQAHLEQNWAQFDYEMYIDDRRVDLEAFGTLDETLSIDFDEDGVPEQYAFRGFDVALDVRGTHQIRYVQMVHQDVDDGLGVTPAGRYEIRSTLQTQG